MDSGLSAKQKYAERMKKLRDLHGKRNEARKLNHQEVVEEDRRNKEPKNMEARRRRAEYILAEESKKAEEGLKAEEAERQAKEKDAAQEAERLAKARKEHGVRMPREKAIIDNLKHSEEWFTQTYQKLK